MYILVRRAGCLSGRSWLPWLPDVERLKAVDVEQVKHNLQSRGLHRLVIHLTHLYTSWLHYKKHSYSSHTVCKDIGSDQEIKKLCILNYSWERSRTCRKSSRCFLAMCRSTIQARPRQSRAMSRIYGFSFWIQGISCKRGKKEIERGRILYGNF